MITAIVPGCFDGLHQGHLHLLRTAKSMCDRLIVALNTDASVKHLKGEGHPANNFVERARALKATGLVDTVAIIDMEADHIEIITRMRPDFVFKGGDYQGKPVTGSDILHEHGGRIVIVPLLGDFGSSAAKVLRGTDPRTCRP